MQNDRKRGSGVHARATSTRPLRTRQRSSDRCAARATFGVLSTCRRRRSTKLLTSVAPLHWQAARRASTTSARLSTNTIFVKRGAWGSGPIAWHASLSADDGFRNLGSYFNARLVQPPSLEGIPIWQPAADCANWEGNVSTCADYIGGCECLTFEPARSSTPSVDTHRVAPASGTSLLQHRLRRVLRTSRHRVSAAVRVCR